MFRRLLKLLTLVLLTVVPGMESCVAATEDFLEHGYLSNAGRTNAEMKTALEQLNAAGKSLLGATAPATATISGDAISAAGPAIVVDTQGGAATDDLRAISTEGVRPGYAVMLWSASAARVVTLRHAPATLGGLSLSGGVDYELGPDKPILLMLVGTAWKEVLSARAADSSVIARGQQIFTANGTFTVPAGVTAVYLSAVGGGGGGGGGGGCGLDEPGSPMSGTNGGATKFNGVTIAAGGVLGDNGTRSGRGGVGGSAGGHDGQPGLTNAAGAAPGGKGGASPFDGGRGSGGSGGAGALDATGTYAPGGGGGGGGSGSVVLHKPVSVTPGAAIAVTIGAAGSYSQGGDGTYGDGANGAAGTAGILIVEW